MTLRVMRPTWLFLYQRIQITDEYIFYSESIYLKMESPKFACQFFYRPKTRQMIS